jgi:hypothetical protein
MEAGGIVMLAGQAARELVRGPYHWFGEFIEESHLILVRCILPLGLAVFAFGFGTIGVEAGGVFQTLGAADRAGGVFVTAAVREVATWATAMVVAGVGGTAITADLGARKVREEIDAMRVLGINPTKQLVLPRMLALIIMTPLLNLVAVLMITFSGIRDEAAVQRDARLLRGDLRGQLRASRAARQRGQDGHLRHDHRRGLLLQGPQRRGRAPGRRPGGQPGRGDLLRRPVDLQLRLHLGAARPVPGAVGAQIDVRDP